MKALLVGVALVMVGCGREVETTAPAENLWTVANGQVQCERGGEFVRLTSTEVYCIWRCFEPGYDKVGSFELTTQGWEPGATQAWPDPSCKEVTL